MHEDKWSKNHWLKTKQKNIRERDKNLKLYKTTPEMNTLKRMKTLSDWKYICNFNQIVFDPAVTERKDFDCLGLFSGRVRVLTIATKMTKFNCPQHKLATFRYVTIKQKQKEIVTHD